MKIELHIHSRCSNDSMLSFKFMKLMCKLKHIDCVAVCDHNTVNGGLIAQKKFSNSTISVIVGEEIFTQDGEIIGLFLKRDIEPGLSAEKTVNEIHKQGGIVYVPHPYDEKRKKTVLTESAIQRIAHQIEIIEVHNGRNISSTYSEKQKTIADKYTELGKTVRVCGSDAHTFFELGRNYMITLPFDYNDPEKFVDALRNGSMVNSDCLMFAHSVTKYVKLAKMILKGKFYEIYRIILRKFKRKSN